MGFVRRAAFLFAPILLLTILACGGGDDTPSPTPTPTPTAEAPTSTPLPTQTPMPTPVPTVVVTPIATPVPAPTPRIFSPIFPPPDGFSGGVLETISPAKFPHRDVHQTLQEALTTLGPGLVYSRMLRVRTDADVVQPSLELECDLCESWQFEAPSSYRFKLRPGIKWHGAPPVRGRELTAQDVACSYERMSGRKLTPRAFSCGYSIPSPEEFPNASLLANVRAIEVEDNLTLRIDLNDRFPDADFLLALADGHAKIVAAEAVNERGDLKEGPDIGTGPWLASTVDLNIGATLQRNPDYFEEGLPFLDEIVTTIIADSQAALAGFLVGQAQVHRVTPSEWTQLQAERRNSATTVVPQVGTGLVLSMNSNQAPFNNQTIRRAMLQALDPWDYVDSLWAGQGDVTVGIPTVRADWLLGRRDMRDTYFADPAAARQNLLSQHPDGPVAFDLLVGDFGDLYREQGNRLKEDLEAAGFNPRVLPLTPPQYAQRVIRDKQYQAALGVLPPSSSTNGFLLSVLHSQGQWNLAAHNDSALDDMIQKQAVQMDLDVRGEQVRNIQRHVLDQAYLFSPVTGATRWVMDPAVRGFFPTTAASEYFFWAKTWLQPRS